MATLVRAIAAVAGTPPNKGSIILPIPCAASSTFAFSFSFFILPAEAPQSSDSISPRAAIDIAGIIIPLTVSQSASAERSKRSFRKTVLGILPTTGISNLNIIFAAVVRMIAARELGKN